MKQIEHEYKDEDGYWIELASGWKDPGDPVGTLHTIHTDTKAEGRREARKALPCDCDDCREKKVTKFKVEVLADSSGQWVGNQVEFDTREKAEAYADDLAGRWTSVRKWRVVEVEEKGDSS